MPGEAFVAVVKVEEGAADRGCAVFREKNLMLPKPMREFTWMDVMYNPNMERSGERKKGRNFKKVTFRLRSKTKLNHFKSPFPFRCRLWTLPR